MVRKFQHKLPYNEKAHFVRKLEEVWLRILTLESYLRDDIKSHPKLEAELKQLGGRYLSLWRRLKKRYRLTGEELAFAEAEMVVELIIDSKDMTEKIFAKKFRGKSAKIGKASSENPSAILSSEIFHKKKSLKRTFGPQSRIFLSYYLCAREESNLYCKIRNLASYPLNDESLLILLKNLLSYQ